MALTTSKAEAQVAMAGKSWFSVSVSATPDAAISMSVLIEKSTDGGKTWEVSAASGIAGYKSVANASVGASHDGSDCLMRPAVKSDGLLTYSVTAA